MFRVNLENAAEAKKLILLASALAIGVALGGIAQKFHLAGKTRVAIYNRLHPPPPPAADVPLVEAPLSELSGKKAMVAVVFGQSNSANFGQTRGTSGAGVYNFHKGKLYKARDPLRGADGEGGSVWTRLGDKLVKRGEFDAVVFVSIGVGSSHMARWEPRGDLFPRLTDSFDSLRKARLAVTHILFQLGEADASLKTTEEQFVFSFMDTLRGIRGRGIDAPVFVALSSNCGGAQDGSEIRRAQQRLPDAGLKIFSGPDVDALTGGARYQVCHLSASGLDSAADLWFESISDPRRRERPAAGAPAF